MRKKSVKTLKKCIDYYPFGMPMPLRNSLSDYRYAFQGQEKDSETGKEAFELRLWDARIGRWLTTDPEGQYSSPYLGMGNSPINGVDPDGGFWRPTVTSNGKVSYIAEKGDSAETFAKQYNVSQDDAIRLVGTGKIEAGVTEVTGVDVQNILRQDSPVLQLDLLSGLATSQRKFDQFLFATDVTKSLGGSSFNPADFFTNFGGGISGSANIDYGLGSGTVKFNIPFLREATFDGSNLPLRIGLGEGHGKFTQGKLFNGKTAVIDIPFFHPISDKQAGRFRLIIHQNHMTGVQKRLARKIAVKSTPFLN